MQFLHSALTLLLLSIATVTQVQASDYHEQLVLKPLPPASLLASFNFRSNTSKSDFEKQNFRYFPRSLGQILQYADTKELHLRFSLGRWDAESWGQRPWDGAKEGGTGVEMWAWVDADSDKEAEKKWLTLTNALSGLFCASLNFIDSTRTTRPVLSFEPVGQHSNTSIINGNLHLLHGTLPREVVCTENLTPFLKLLPCKGKAGISSLLDGHKLFDASWQSMSIDVRPVCPHDGTECLLEITQTVDMVLDIQRSKRPQNNPIPRPVHEEDLKCDMSKPYHAQDTCFPLDEDQDDDWSISQIFGHTLKGSCPLSDADLESVCLQVPNTRDVYTTGGAIERKNDNGYERCFTLSEQEFEIYLPPQDHTDINPMTQPTLYAERSFTGYGQESGGVQVILTNPSSTGSVDFTYMESLPWFMKVYLHTLNAKIASNTSSTTASIIKDIYYRPALDRVRGTQLELLISIPPASIAILTYEFEKAILRYTEYPPDANRGFDVPSAIITLADGQSIRTTTLLLPLPTPDFSMPYNVIILTSTVMALAFGSIFNLLVRRFVGADEGDKLDLRVYRLKAIQGVKMALANLGGKARKRVDKVE